MKHLLTILLTLHLPLFAYAEEAHEVHIQLNNGTFSPAAVQIPSGKKIKLIVTNHDTVAEEFESYDLNREKIVPPQGQISVFVGPLEPGTYEYFGDFHPDTAQGTIIAE